MNTNIDDRKKTESQTTIFMVSVIAFKHQSFMFLKEYDIHSQQIRKNSVFLCFFKSVIKPLIVY